MRLIDVDDLGVGRCSKDVLPAAYCAGWNGLLGLIEKAPTVDAAPVVYGNFVHDGPRFAGGVDWWHCSNCGKLASGVETRFDYCPFCGARMDGDDDAKAD